MGRPLTTGTALSMDLIVHTAARGIILTTRTRGGLLPSATSGAHPGITAGVAITIIGTNPIVIWDGIGAGDIPVCMATHTTTAITTLITANVLPMVNVERVEALRRIIPEIIR